MKKYITKKSLIFTTVLAVTFAGVAYAATNVFASQEAESGTKTGNVATVSDITASGNSAVKFGTAPQTCPVSDTSHVPDGPDGMGGCWPGPFTTGVPSGATLTNYNGPCGIHATTVIQNKTVNCDLQVYDNASLTITNSVINGFIENSYSDGTGEVVIDDSEMNSGEWQGGTLWGSYITANRVEIIGGQHSVACGGNCEVNDSWLHGQTAPAGVGTHNNAFISNGGSNFVVRHNSLFCSPPDNGAGGGCSADLSLFGDFEPIANATIDRNLIMATPSGGYCGYFGYNPGKAYPNPSNIAVTNNVFQRGPSTTCGIYGPVTSFTLSAPGAVWSNNRYDDGTVVDPAE